MRISKKHMGFIYFLILITIIVGLPLGIRSYDQHVWQKKIPPGAKEFTLTGHTQKGWILGEVQASDLIHLKRKNMSAEKPVIEVFKGDLVFLKLKSSDVIHGFSFREAGIFITDGIQPGKVKLVSFRADRVGKFTFSCNAICGDNHQNMQGTIVVKA
jgi:heme/copper-type cytochrome/quinol oxidase subunit 2